MALHTQTIGTPKIDSAERCEASALNDLQVGSVGALISMVSAALAALEVYPNHTVPAAVVTGVMSVPFILNGISNVRLAKKHRAGIVVPG